MTLNGNTNETLGYNTVIKNGETNDSNHVKAVMPPFLSITGWDKTPLWSTVNTGTADTDTADKLVDTGATFESDGVVAGMIVKNTDNDTFAIVGAVDSEISLSLSADIQAGSATTDLFPDGNEGYTIFNNFELPDCWVEMNGQTISDADSPWNGKTLPDINGTAEAGKKFLRGASDGTGTEGSAINHFHTLTAPGGIQAGGANYSHVADSKAHIPPYFEVVWIMRIK